MAAIFGSLRTKSQQLKRLVLQLTATTGCDALDDFYQFCGFFGEPTIPKLGDKLVDEFVLLGVCLEGFIILKKGDQISTLVS